MNAIAESMNDTSASITNLGKKSAEIGEIIHLITGISEQTNLLALNAAIEPLAPVNMERALLS
ncbi:hypothetical protein JCM9152_2895 [Halalkalibacter hemicellulosilyticusJCM 9152]|uniref:Methyl-accepting transducer domain-containing protein n=1 Tax=Halalkalibacter hemicellulosilyticusJCM 9152 TaxID=1236971 RepID=W4QH84_9BACI|nr:methyl-accepting chemotaxis protein [Halalkalibacter hemicellulosilyticus]GAE31426.1 hypothetical protein JCM9152_2895 [Halalkalibacter hemicellulosilyticusJCM 9152]